MSENLYECRICGEVSGHKPYCWANNKVASAPASEPTGGTGERSAAIPEGWKLVPIEPTDQMTFVGQSMRYEPANSIGAIYRAMLYASPAAPQPQNHSGLPSDSAQNTDIRATVALQTEVDRLTALLNTPEIHDFTKAVSLESAHQRERWGAEGDAGKAPADWFWLVGYLAGKALHAHAAGNHDKALHHVITTAAACCNWHAAMLGTTDMRPGIAQPQGQDHVAERQDDGDNAWFHDPDMGGTMSAELLPCPHCGGGAELGQIKDWPFAACKDCRIRTQIFPLSEQAIAAWNRRTQSPTVALNTSSSATVLAKIWFHRMPDGDYEIHDSANMPTRPDGCNTCVQAIVIKQEWAGEASHTDLEKWRNDNFPEQVAKEAMDKAIENGTAGELIASRVLASHSQTNATAKTETAPAAITEAMIDAANSAWLDGYAPNRQGTEEALRRALAAQSKGKDDAAHS